MIWVSLDLTARFNSRQTFIYSALMNFFLCVDSLFSFTPGDKTKIHVLNALISALMILSPTWPPGEVILVRKAEWHAEHIWSGSLSSSIKNVAVSSSNFHQFVAAAA